MSRITIAFFYTLLMFHFTYAGIIRIDPFCPPKQVHILIKDDQGKTVIDQKLSDPKDQTPIQIRLDSSRSYRFRVETFPPGVLCTFSGARGDRLPADPDLVCTCLQNNGSNTGINMRPGRWRLWTARYHFTRPSPYCNIPTPAEIHCVKDPERFFSVRRLGEIEDNAGCPYIMIRQGTHEGEWKRQGPKCEVIHGKVKYLGTALDEEIRYYAPPDGFCGDLTIYIKGKWLGPCKEQNTTR